MGAPAYAFENDTDTGMYRTGTNAIGFAFGGTLRLTLDDTTRGDAWQSYTPTFSGAVSAIGTSTISAAYTKVGRRVHFRVSCTFAGATFAAGDMTVTLPVTASGSMTGGIGNAILFDTGTTTNTGVVVMASTTTVKVRVTIAGAGLVTNTVPHTWANTDVIHLNGTYESAA